MDKIKKLQHKNMVEKQQLHGIKNSSIKKNEDSKFKHTPKDKAILINDLKAQGNCIPSQKASTNAKNQNQNLLKKQTSSSNAEQSKQGSPNGKQNFSSKGQKLNKTKTNPKKMEEQFDDSSSDIDEGIVPQDVTISSVIYSLNEMGKEDSETDTPDIFEKSLGDELDEDEDFEEEDGDETGAEDEDVKEEEDNDSDEEEVVQHKCIKMFEGLQSKAMNDDDEEDQEEDDDDDNDDDDEDEANDNAITKAYIMKKEKVITKKKADETPNKKDVSKGNTIVEKETELVYFLENFVYVHNIPKGIPMDAIKLLFGQYGVIKYIDYPLTDSLHKVRKYPKKMATAEITRATTVIGSILYETKESALKAAKSLHGTKLFGNYLSVVIGRECVRGIPSAKTIYFSTKRRIEENEIWETFGKCGHIKHLERSGLNKEGGCVVFDSKDAVHLALKLNGIKIMGRRLEVLPFSNFKEVQRFEQERREAGNNANSFT